MPHAEPGTRNPRGWGFLEEAPPAEETARVADLLALRFPGHDLAVEEPATPAPLPAPRLAPPAALAEWCASDAETRRAHTLGRSYPDLVRALRADFDGAPDVVARPPDAAGVAATLEWCAAAGAVCVPFGGGTSVVGGVDTRGIERPVVVLQTRAMDRVLEVDAGSRAARVEGGATGPVLEAQLAGHGLTFRFFPQSFALSTLGGWIATRAAGHFATGPTHVDDLIEAVSAVTPAGTWASRRLPASGAGPSPDRLLLGSEGTLGVVTEAWIRVRPRPRFRASTTVRFRDQEAAAPDRALLTGCAAVRALAQSGLQPAGCRLLDPVEAALNGLDTGGAAVLLLALESADVPVAAAAAQAVQLCRDHGGEVEGITEAAGGGAGEWRKAFLRMPYLRDALIARGVLSDTFESAVTWDALPGLLAAVREAVEGALREVCGDGVLTVRLTHAYPDGAAPYWTVVAPARRGSELAQWAQVKAAAGEALLAAGGTITHHHAVGRDHRPWYDRQRPEAFAAALRGAKAAVDPLGLLNPGVLLDP